MDDVWDIYVTGNFNAKMELGTDESSLTLKSLNDIFVAKYDSNGGLLWASQWKNDDLESAGNIVLDGLGNSYVTGTTTKPDRRVYRAGDYYPPPPHLFLVKFPAVDLPE